MKNAVRRTAVRGFALSLGGIIVCAAISVAGAEPSEGIVDERLDPSNYATPEPGALLRTIISRGVFEPLKETPVPTRIQRTISFIARDGEKVEKGAIILKLDDADDIRGRDDRLDIIKREIKRLEQTVQRFLQERMSQIIEQERRGWEAELSRLERRLLETPSLDGILSAEERRYSTLRQLESQIEELRLFEETLAEGAYPLSEIEKKRSAVKTTELNLRTAEIALDLARSGASEIDKRSQDMTLVNRLSELDTSIERENETRIRQGLSIRGSQNGISENIRRYDRDNSNLKQMTLVAPKAGIVSVKMRWGNPWAVGQRTHNGGVPVSIADDTALKAVAYVPDISGLKAGLPVVVSAPAIKNRRLAGKIIVVSDQGEDEFKSLASETRQIVMGDAERIVYRVDVELIETPRELINGMNCEVCFLEIPAGQNQTDSVASPSTFLKPLLESAEPLADAVRKNAEALGARRGLIIPIRAVRASDDGRSRFVWVELPGGRLSRVTVEIAAETAISALVTGGLKGGERIYMGAVSSENESN